MHLCHPSPPTWRITITILFRLMWPTIPLTCWITLTIPFRLMWPTIPLTRKCANSNLQVGQLKSLGWVQKKLLHEKDCEKNVKRMFINDNTADNWLLLADGWWLMASPQINMSIGDISAKEILSLYSPSGKSGIFFYIHIFVFFCNDDISTC